LTMIKVSAKSKQYAIVAKAVPRMLDMSVGLGPPCPPRGCRCVGLHGLARQYVDNHVVDSAVLTSPKVHLLHSQHVHLFREL
jgi:hypothetical protein